MHGFYIEVVYISVYSVCSRNPAHYLKVCVVQRFQ